MDDISRITEKNFAIIKSGTMSEDEYKEKNDALKQKIDQIRSRS
jgi:hypothetical protein